MYLHFLPPETVENTNGFVCFFKLKSIRMGRMREDATATAFGKAPKKKNGQVLDDLENQ